MDDRCWNCSNVVEDTDHVLRKCPRARELWSAILPSQHRAYESRSMLDWLDNGISLKKSGNTPGDDSSLFAITLWWIWKWRNNAVFNNKVTPLWTRVSWIMSQWDEINTAFTRAENQQIIDNQRSWKKQCWSKPCGQFLKMNVDGSVDPLTNRAGCGGILRDNEGKWKGGFVSNIGSCSPLQDEAWALLRGIQLAIRMGCKKVISECDSQEVVENIYKDSALNAIAHNILVACKRELHIIEVWQVVWVAREQNKTADKLAALFRTFDRGVHLLYEPPYAIRYSLEDDTLGIPCWRNANGNS